MKERVNVCRIKMNIFLPMTFVLLAVLFILCGRADVNAAGADTTAPEITRFDISPNSVSSSKPQVRITMDVIEEESGVRDIWVEYGRHVSGTNGMTMTSSQVGSYDGNQYSGTVENYIWLELGVGDYYILQITVTDQAGNTSSYIIDEDYANPDNVPSDENGTYMFDSKDSSKKCYFTNRMCKVTGSSDTPYVNATKIRYRTIPAKRGDALSLEMYTAQAKSVKSAEIGLFNLDKKVSLNSNLIPEISCQNDKIILTVKIPENVPSGEYMINFLVLYTSESNTYYHGYSTNPAAWRESDDGTEYMLNDVGNRCSWENKSTFDIASNGDDEAPSITSIHFRNPQIEKPGVIKLDLTIEDNASIGNISVFIYNDNMGANWVKGADKNINKEIKKTSLTLSIPISTSDESGIYYITDIRVSDMSGNERYYYRSFLCDWVYDEDGNGKEVKTLITNDEGDYLKDGPDGDFLHFDGYSKIEATDEFDVDFQVGINNKTLKDRIRNMPEGTAGKINIGYHSKASKELFTLIKGKDKTLIFYRDNFQWIFNGKDIKKPKDVKLEIMFSPVSGEDYGSSTKLLQIQFENHGTLPGKANIRIKSDFTYHLYKLEGELHLYYCNEDVEQLELENNSGIERVLDGNDNWCCFDITHNSRFLASGRKLTKTKILPQKGTGIKEKDGTGYKITVKGKEVALTDAGKKQTLTIPSTITYKGIKYAVTKIADNAFKNNKTLTKVTIGSKVKTIGAKAFYGCKKLSSVTIGINVDKIGKQAFKNCKKLKKINIKTTHLTSGKVGSKAFSGTHKKIQIKVPGKMKKKYKKWLFKKGVSKKAKIK